MRLLGLAALALACSAACSEAPEPLDPDLYVESTHPPRPPKGRLWLRRDGKTKLWWADELRREDLVPCVSTWDAVDQAEKEGMPFIEVEAGPGTLMSLVGRNEEGNVVLTFPRNEDGACSPCRYNGYDPSISSPPKDEPPPAPPSTAIFPPLRPSGR